MFSKINMYVLNNNGIFLWVFQHYYLFTAAVMRQFLPQGVYDIDRQRKYYNLPSKDRELRQREIK